VHTGPLQLIRTGFDRLWDWTIYQLYSGWTFLAKKLKRPYELAKMIVFWAVVLVMGLWLLYYLSMGLYLGFYFLVLRPPAVPTLLQPLNLRYPDPGTADYIYAYHCITPVTYPQTYNWKLSLEMPENPTNFDAGVFMVSLALYPPDQLPTQPHEEVRDMFYNHLQGNVGNPSAELQKTGDKLRIGSRPVMLRWRPDIYRWIQTLFFALPRLALDIVGFGWFEETQHMEVNMIERHETAHNSTYHTKQCFVVSINNPKVQIYKASIEATVLLEGWRYLLYSWFWTCFFIGSLFIFFSLLTAISLYWTIVLITGIVKGEIKFPKLWYTDEEQQMKEMKEAVAALLQQKRLESYSRGSTDSLGPLETKSSRETLTSPRKTEKDPLFGPSPKMSPTNNSDRPKSWIDEPFDIPHASLLDSTQFPAPVTDGSLPPQKADPVFKEDLPPHRRSHRASLEASSSSFSEPIQSEWPARLNRFERDADPLPFSEPKPKPSDPSTPSSDFAVSNITQSLPHRTMFASLISDDSAASSSAQSTDLEPSTAATQVPPAVTIVDPSMAEETLEEGPIGLSDLLHAPIVMVHPPTTQSYPEEDNELH
jgi:hypothetical protein